MIAETADEIVAGLSRLIARNLPDADAIRIEELRPIHGGASSEIWAFEGCWCRAGGQVVRRPLILRRAARQEFRSAGRAAEFHLLRALAPTPIPAPRACWLDEGGEYLGRPAMVMERVAGAADRRLLSAKAAEQRTLAQRVHLAGSMAELLGSLHRLDVATLDLPAAMRAAADPARDQLAAYDAEIARQALEPLPELRLASLWLREHLPPPPARTVLVHGDFRPANLLIANGEVAALLDWEFAHEGDPAEDLGWYLASRYAADHLIPGAWSRDDFLERYARLSGCQPDPIAIRFWSVFALYKLVSMALTALRAGMEGDPARMIHSLASFTDALLAETAA